MPLLTSRPKWTPSKVGRVLVWSEQGVGDVIMFSSIIPEIYKICDKLIVQIDERLIPLFKRSFPADIHFCPNDYTVPESEYDAQIPIGSLPLHFRQTSGSFKVASNGYLFSDKIKATSIRENILQDGPEILIGISWYSNSKLNAARERSISLQKVARTLAKPNVKLVSLQYGNVEQEIADVRKDLDIEVIQVQEINNREDIDGLAALISACDSVVSIDNATVHLAGAIGKETQVLLPYSCDWRWGRERRSSYWYDAVHLHRQTNFGDWCNVLKQL
jgi:ADP-heptose:LPS heptosyltransferase